MYGMGFDCRQQQAMVDKLFRVGNCRCASKCMVSVLVVGQCIVCRYWCGVGFWFGWRTFFVFKSFDNNMVYTFDIDVYVCKRNRCTTKVLWVLKFLEVGDQNFFFKIKAGRTVFNFSCKTSFFLCR